MKKDNLGDRMKQFYETVPKTRLMRRCPVIIRLDGKSAHTFTRGFDKPFDCIFRGAMQSTMKFLCENIQGCQLGYCQSDEITLVLIDYTNLDTQAWYDYEVQKMCSVSASMATLEFNRAFVYFTEAMTAPLEGENEVHHLSARKGLMFDSRCFNVPKEEVCNALYWRQLDAMRNSVQMVARNLFSHNKLQGKSCEEIKQMIINWKYLPWENYPLDEQRGCCCVKGEKGWEIDYNIPIFAREREYVNSRILWEDKMKLWIDYEVAPPSDKWVWAQSLGRALAEIIHMEGSVYIGENDSLEEVSIYNNPEDIMGLLYYFSTHNINCPVLIHGEGENV